MRWIQNCAGNQNRAGTRLRRDWTGGEGGEREKKSPKGVLGANNIPIPRKITARAICTVPTSLRSLVGYRVVSREEASAVSWMVGVVPIV